MGLWLVVLADGQHHLPPPPEYEPLAGYEPNSVVADIAAIDLDQRVLAAALATPDFAAAKAIYEDGGHSRAIAELTVAPLERRVRSSTLVSGINATGAPILGLVASDTDVDATVVAVLYRDVQTALDATQGPCHVGALEDPVTSGCFDEGVPLSISGHGSLTPSRIVNVNGRTLQGFSTRARAEMMDPGMSSCPEGNICLYEYYDCQGCPYKDFMPYHDYYGAADYADRWITAALDGAAMAGVTEARSVDFTGAAEALRAEAVRRGTVLLSVWMFVVRKFEEGIDDCVAGCLYCNEHGAHAWDEGVALYAGSLVGTDGRGGGGAISWVGGELLFTLANEQCSYFRTCTTGGNSNVNVELLALFTDAQGTITGDRGRLNPSGCSTVRSHLWRIVDLMTVPLIQGALRSAYLLAHLSASDQERGAAAAFAAAVLPRLSLCDADAASRVHANLRVGASAVDFEAVKLAFESQLDCLNVTCTDIGGLWDEGTGSYYFRCGRAMDPPPPPETRPDPAESRDHHPHDHEPEAALPADAAGLPPPPPLADGSGQLLRLGNVPDDSEAFSPVGVAMIVLVAVVLAVVLAILLFLFLRRRRRRANEAAARERSIAMTQLRMGRVEEAVSALPRRLYTAEDAAAAPAIECSVCLATFAVGDELRHLPCGHEFHLKCVDAWLLGAAAASADRVSATCPLCKAVPLDVDRLLAEAGAPSATATRDAAR